MKDRNERSALLTRFAKYLRDSRVQSNEVIDRVEHFISLDVAGRADG